MDSNSKRLRGRKWSYIGNTSRSLKSGVMILWQTERWTLRNAYSTCSRTVIAHYGDEDGMEWTVVCAHFHHDPGPRRKQWTRLTNALQRTMTQNVIMLVDHNSILDETLDVRESEATPQTNSYYRQITRDARTKEKEACDAVGITDVWPLIHEEVDDSNRGLTYPATEPRRRIDRISVGWSLQTSVTGAYNVVVGKSDHLGVVARLDPEEDGTGTKRRTLQGDVVKTPEFQQRMRELLEDIQELEGTEWWEEAIEGAHEVARQLRRPEERWTSGIRRMEKALKDSTVEHMGPEARRILSEEGYEGEDPYRHLMGLQQKEKSRHQRQEVLQRLREKLQDEEGYTSTTGRDKEQQTIRLLRQITTKQQMVAVMDTEGKLRTGTSQVGQAQREFWTNVMVSPQASDKDCERYIDTMGNTHQWEVTLPRLWKEPTRDTVLTALERLDPSSAPGEDGIPALLYQTFPEYFCDRMLTQLEDMKRKGEFPTQWSKGIMRCVQKEKGNLRVDKQRPIMLLGTKGKWATMTLKIGLEDYVKAIIPPAQRGFVQGRSMQ